MREREGFEAVVVACGDRLHGAAYLLTHDHGLAEDLVQTALAKAWFAWPRIQGSPEPYIREVLLNTFLSSRRRRWWGERPTEELPAPPAPGGADDVDGRLDLASALRHLPPRQRAVVVLRYVEDLTEREVAQLMRCSVGTVKSQTSKALAKLRVDSALQDPAWTGGPW